MDKYGDKLETIERKVEEKAIGILQTQCSEEKQSRKCFFPLSFLYLFLSCYDCCCLL